MKAVRITNSHFETNGWGISEPRFVGGQHYPLDAGTQRQVDLGNGEIIEVPDDPEKAQTAAEAAEVRAEKAAVAAQAARDAANAAAQAAAAVVAEPAAAEQPASD